MAAHQEMIDGMKKDLDFIFNKCRALKRALDAKHHELYAEVDAEFADKRKAIVEEEE